MHPTLTPLAPDVDFRVLAERYEATGGDIRNAVLKAAMAAAAEPGRDNLKSIHQRHLDEGIRDVIAAKRVMRQSLFTPQAVGKPDDGLLQSVREMPAATWLPLAISAVAALIAVLALVVAAVR